MGMGVGVNRVKVAFIVIVIVIVGTIYLVTQKDTSEAIGIWINEKLSHQKIEVSEGPLVEKVKPPLIIKVERPDIKASAKFAFHYKLYGKGDIVMNAETVSWKIASLDQAQIVWEGADHQIEAYSRNPFLPPLSASETLFNKTPRLDYLTSPEIFPLSSSEPKVVKIQDRTVTDSKPYDWSCLVTGEETLNSMAGEFPVQVITCVVSGGKSGIETFKYSKAHGHWIARERSGFDLPKLTVELVSYSAE